MINKGCLIVSFDCEGKWGFADRVNEYHDKIFTDENIISSYVKVLDILANNSIKATFAFVGAFTLSKDEFFEKKPDFSNGFYANDRWLKHFNRQVESRIDYTGWFCPGAYKAVIAREEHEIASHGFTHLPFDEKLVKHHDIKQELNSIRLWAKGMSIDLSTFIFPRNKVGFIELLLSEGIEAYRNVPLYYGVKPRLKAEIMKYTPPYLSEGHSSQSKPLEIPGGNLIAFRKKVKLPPNTLIINRWKKMIDDAVENNGVVHIWMHPHNLIDGIDQAYLFDVILAYAAKYIRENKLLNLTQKEYVDAINASKTN